MDPVQEIKEKISIEELVSEYLTLKPAGIHLKALCPFHAEKTPSFVVSPARGTFHCFGCGKHGDIFTFLQEMEGIDFKEALQKLAEKAGVEIKNYTPQTTNKKEQEEIKKALALAKDFFVSELQKNSAALNYLKERGIKDKTIENFALGFAPDSWDALYKHLLSLNISSELQLKAGLIKKGNSGKYYDRFRSRIMFPIFDAQGSVLAFSGRIFGKDDEAAKYINSPETLVFNKSSVLYGYNFAKSTMRKFDFAILVEGQADLLAMHQAGFTNSVAISGTALTDKHISLISRFTKNILLALDSDSAGVASMIKNARKLFTLGFNIKVLSLPQGLDPADILKNEGEGKIKELVKNAPNIFDFLIEYFADSLQNNDKYVRVLRSEVLPLLASLGSKVEAEMAAQKLAKALSVSVESVLEDVAKVASVAEDKTIKSMSAQAPLENKQSTKSIFYKLQVFKTWLSALSQEHLNVKNKQEFLLQLDELENILREFKSASENLDIKEKDLLVLDDTLLQSKDLALLVKEELKALKKQILKEKLSVLRNKILEAEAKSDEKQAESLSKDALKITSELADL